jgi:hypothetical protein
MHVQRTSRSHDPDGGGVHRARVVILDEGTTARVAVLELPEDVGIGASFCHSGTCWRVTGTRTSSRVFIAERIH